MLLCAKRTVVDFYFRWDGEVSYKDDFMDFLKEFSTDVECQECTDKWRFIGKSMQPGEREFSIILPKKRVVYVVYNDVQDEYKLIEPIVFHSRYMQLGEE